MVKIFFLENYLKSKKYHNVNIIMTGIINININIFNFDFEICENKLKIKVNKIEWIEIVFDEARAVIKNKEDIIINFNINEQIIIK